VFNNFMADADALFLRLEKRLDAITRKFHKQKKSVEKRKEV
jgi:hypothetical protein